MLIYRQIRQGRVFKIRLYIPVAGYRIGCSPLAWGIGKPFPAVKYIAILRYGCKGNGRTVKRCAAGLEIICISFNLCENRTAFACAKCNGALPFYKCNGNGYVLCDNQLNGARSGCCINTSPCALFGVAVNRTLVPAFTFSLLVKVLLPAVAVSVPPVLSFTLNVTVYS